MTYPDNVKQAWETKKDGVRWGPHGWRYENHQGSPMNPNRTTIRFLDLIQLFEWVAEEQVGADYWSITRANKMNNNIHLGFDYPSDRDNYDKKLGDQEIEARHLVEAIDEIMKKYEVEL